MEPRTVAIHQDSIHQRSIKALRNKNLAIRVYVARNDAGMRVASVLIVGRSEVLLIDTQFTRSEAYRVVAEILGTGKKLTTVYITHAHPDHYFGTEVIQTAFPQANVLALPQTVREMEQTYEKKLEAWSDALGANAPLQIVFPEVLPERALSFEGEQLEILAPLQGDSPGNSAVWIPSMRALVAADTVFADTHVWTAGTTVEQRQQWLRTLEQLEALKPRIVIPGHCIGESFLDRKAIEFTRTYLRTFDKECAKAKGVSSLVQAMKSRFPDAALSLAIELGAKANLNV